MDGRGELEQYQQAHRDEQPDADEQQHESRAPVACLDLAAGGQPGDCYTSGTAQ